MMTTNSAAAESEFLFHRENAMRKLVTVLIMTVAWHTTAMTQEPNLSKGAFYYPASAPDWTIKPVFDILFARVPYDVVEENQTLRWPLFSLRALVTMPENFAVQADVSTNIVNWNFLLGPKWRYQISDRIATYVGADVSFFTGKLNAGQIDQSATGWFAGPTVSIGYAFDDFSLTMKGELNYLLSIGTRTGSIETDRSSTMYNGWGISAFVEQPLWGDNYMIYGVRMNNIKFYYQTWLLAPTFNKFYYVPEAIIGIRL